MLRTYHFGLKGRKMANNNKIVLNYPGFNVKLSLTLFKTVNVPYCLYNYAALLMVMHNGGCPQSVQLSRFSPLILSQFRLGYILGTG